MRGVAGLAVWAAALAAGQTPNILELARKAPPELFADAVIKLVDRGEIPSPTQRRDLLEEAFRAAKQAREPVRLVAIPELASADRRAGLRDVAGAQKLDALSLESRVVALVAKADPVRARELFESIEHPPLEARPCEDPMIADISAYYEMAGKVGSGAPFLMSVIGPASSPGEMANAAKLLGSASALTADEFRLVLGALALKMEMVAPDYRSFTITADELRVELRRLAERARELDVPMEPLETGARKLATTQLGSPRCNEEFGDAMTFANFFNLAFHGSLSPIREEETMSRKALGWAKADSYFGSGSGKEMVEGFQRLRQALGKPEWGERLKDFLQDFSQWKPEGADIDDFHRKVTVLHGLYQLIPAGEDRDKLAARTTEFLRSNGIEKAYPAEWLLQVRSFAESALGDRAKLMAGFRESEDPGLALFAALNP
jgi:hypothetical protein